MKYTKYKNRNRSQLPSSKEIGPKSAMSSAQESVALQGVRSQLEVVVHLLSITWELSYSCSIFENILGVGRAWVVPPPWGHLWICFLDISHDIPEIRPGFLKMLLPRAWDCWLDHANMPLSQISSLRGQFIAPRNFNLGPLEQKSSMFNTNKQSNTNKHPV